MSPSGNAATADEPVIGQDGVSDGVRGVRLRSPARIPLSLKLAYSAFMAVLVPVYLTQYGPTNFLYFCDIALILTLVGIWAESALLVSVCAVGLLAPQTLWVVDFAAEAAGTPLTGMTAYMFNRETSPFLRGLSLFHGWLPFLLVFLVWRLGYDRRAWTAWSALAVVVLFVCFFLMPPPRPDPGLTPVNINYVWGMSDHAAQTMMPAWAWFAGLVAGIPLLICWPTHRLLIRLMPKVPVTSPAASHGGLAPR
ncbi:hypothetical protein H0176_12280 [Methylorubrum populi]|uniref:Membrane-associated protein n=2 Tax=Methylorubrum rhodesianum TaxID=29427 RepID=A0ABU9ZJ06_9HYPH|nr:hypothetical protein [Methylorubrum rhodesianum]MBK3403533.1 hypothetical protein [Methylorubrum rhodesianum]MBY0141047.1 hypothetical protein [Methylorubrum populi]